MSGVNLELVMAECATLLTRFLDMHFEKDEKLLAGHQKLQDSVRYSLLQEGGKRFRPVLAMLTAEALGHRPERVLAFAGAVECVHTYSLIHDDLPAMDNDDFRRGQPTNHKKFDEATAILAGDALLTEAFQIVADNYSEQPRIAIRTIQELAKASGFHGMVGGQSIDMSAKKESISIEELRTMHAMKTGALIRVAAVGAAIICEATPEQLKQITIFSDSLGLAFQVADDLLDFDRAKPEPGSYPTLMGPDETAKFLQDLTEDCLESLSSWTSHAEPLREIARYNQSRSI